MINSLLWLQTDWWWWGCGAFDLTVCSLLWNHSKPMCRTCQCSRGFYVNPCTNKFVGPHPRASGDGYVVPGERNAAIQQQAAYLERLVLSAPLLEDKSFKDTHYLTIVVPSHCRVSSHTGLLEHMPWIRWRITGLILDIFTIKPFTGRFTWGIHNNVL